MGKTIACLGDNQKGNFPAVCSINIATNLSTEPKIALCIMIGLSNPFFNNPSSFIFGFNE